MLVRQPCVGGIPSLSFPEEDLELGGDFLVLLISKALWSLAPVKFLFSVISIVKMKDRPSH